MPIRNSDRSCSGFFTGNRYGGSFFVLSKAVLRVGAKAIFPFKRLFKRKMGKLPGRLLGTITKEKEPLNEKSAFKSAVFDLAVSPLFEAALVQ